MGMLWSAGAIGLVIGVIIRLLPWDPSAVVSGFIGVLVLGGGIVLAGAPDIGSLYGLYALSLLCGLIGAVAGMALFTVLSRIRSAAPDVDDDRLDDANPLDAMSTRSSSSHRNSSHRSHRHETSLH